MKALKSILLILILSITNHLDSFSQKKNPTIEVIKNLHNSAMWVTPRYILGKKDDYKMISVPKEEFNEWLAKYNKNEKKALVIYKQSDNSLMLIPANMIKYYEDHELKLKQEEEKAELLAQELRDKEERELMDKIADKPNDIELWKSYLDKYSKPKGKLYDENIEYAEIVFFEDFLSGSQGSLKNYLAYFQSSNKYPILVQYIMINNAWEKATEFTDLSDLNFSFTTKIFGKERNVLNEEYVKQQRLMEQFVGKLNDWKDSKINASDKTKELVNQIYTNFLKKARKIIEHDKEEISLNKSYETKYADLVVGENRCFLKSVQLTEKEDGYKYDPVSIDIRVNVFIVDINKATSEIQIRVNDIYNLTYGMDVRNFNYALNERISWKKNTTMWIHPSDFDLEHCYLDKFKPKRN